ncbi:amidase [uncultured Sulfitobacter sp.]|uniref:amidase n=1 Tax=uncultured Sulfitobacter sp. TaxID=191468 RepID=UPI00262760ED|nr:amidase [uncultured Sulfitobacter sp.]
MTTTDLAYLPAYKTLEMFRAKTLSPVEHMQAVLDRAGKVEPHINAFTYTYFDEAMDKAKKAEAKYAGGKPVRKLEGLAIGVKDESEIKGLPTSNGSLAMKDYVADRTSPVNERMLRAGGIVHARTATPEFSCTVTTHSKLWGITRNPWNLELSPGGSSGGSAASLAAGTSALCSGSDIGGSIRIPSSTCGLYGLKPTFGRNPADTPFNLDHYAVDGPLARTAKDMILLQNTMCGPHRDDMVSLRPKLNIPMDVQSIKGWKIAYSPNLGFYEVSEDVRENTEAALDAFRSAGAIVEEVDLRWTSDVLDGAMQHLEHLFGGSLMAMVDENPDIFMPYTRAIVDGARDSNAVKFLEAGEIANRMYSELSRIFAKYRLLVCPTTALPSVPADSDGVTTPIYINGKQVHPLHGWIMTVPFNMLCRCPVVSAPSGIGATGVPTGLQIVGHTYRDQDVCRAALAYEAVRGEGFAGSGEVPKICV